MITAASRLLFSIFFVMCTIYNNCNLYGQEIQQITNAESQQFDSFYEQFFTLNGKGYYTSYIDDRVSIFEMDTKQLVYKTSFDLCERDMASWGVEDRLAIYFGYKGIIIEDIFDGILEEYEYPGSYLEDENYSLFGAVNKGLLSVTLFPVPERIQFDIKKRHFLDIRINKIAFTTEENIYYTVGQPWTNHFIKYNRSTFETDTLLSGFNDGVSYIPSEDKYYFITAEHPIMVIDSNDDIAVYDFEHGIIKSAVETTTGRLLFEELSSEGSIIYELDLESTELVRRDTVFGSRVKLLDSYQDRIFVYYDTGFDTYYGYIDYPNYDVETFIEYTGGFSDDFTSKSQDLFIVQRYGDYIFRDVTIVEKQSNEINNFKIQSLELYFDDEFEVIDTDGGIRFVISKEEGKKIYEYDEATSSISEITTIDNKRGLGTAVQKNGESYLISEVHNLHSGFEYIHPETKKLVFHQVDGIIHGDVLPYEGNFYYIRNQNYQGIDENFYLDHVMFDPVNNELKIIEEDYFYPKIFDSFRNLNYSEGDFGFKTIFNTSLLFDLRNQTSISQPGLTKTLLENIYFESENYFFSNSDSPDYINYKIDKNDYELREDILEADFTKIIPVDDFSFIGMSYDQVNYITEDDWISIEPPTPFNWNFVGIFDRKLLLQGNDGSTKTLKVYNLDTGEENEFEVEGYIADMVGDHIICIKSFEPPYNVLSRHISTGEEYQTTLNQEYERFYKTNSSLYIHDQLQDEVKIFNPQLQIIETIDAEILQNTRIEIISETDSFPLILRAQRPGLVDYHKNVTDYSLIIFDSQTNSFTEYFDCESDLRFNKLFDLGLTSTMLLRSKDDSYQLYEVEIPELMSVSIDEKLASKNLIKISPNPTNRFIQIDSEYESAILYNFLGASIQKYENEKVIDLEGHHSGVYYLSFVNKSGSLESFKIIKH